MLNDTKRCPTRQTAVTSTSILSLKTSSSNMSTPLDLVGIEGLCLWDHPTPSMHKHVILRSCEGTVLLPQARHVASRCQLQRCHPPPTLASWVPVQSYIHARYPTSHGVLNETKDFGPKLHCLRFKSERSDYQLTNRDTIISR